MMFSAAQIAALYQQGYLYPGLASLQVVPAVAVLPLAQELEVLRSEVQNLKDRLEKKQAALSQLVDPAAGIADNLSALLRPTEEPAEFKPQRFYRTTLNGAMATFFASLGEASGLDFGSLGAELDTALGVLAYYREVHRKEAPQSYLAPGGGAINADTCNGASRHLMSKSRHMGGRKRARREERDAATLGAYWRSDAGDAAEEVPIDGGAGGAESDKEEDEEEDDENATRPPITPAGAPVGGSKPREAVAAAARPRRSRERIKAEAKARLAERAALDVKINAILDYIPVAEGEGRVVDIEEELERLERLGGGAGLNDRALEELRRGRPGRGAEPYAGIGVSEDESE